MAKALDHSDQEQKIMLFAVVVSFTLHVFIAYLLPYLNTLKQVDMPLRIEMDVFQNIQSAKETSAPPTPAPPKGEAIENPAPVQKPQKVAEKKADPTPVLASESTVTNNDYQVAPQSAPTQPNLQPNVDATESTAEKNIPAVATSGSPLGVEEAKVVTENVNENASQEEAWDGYGQQLYDLVNQGKNYPTIAIRRNWEGEVKLKVTFIQGKLTRVEIINVSAYKPLDEEALKMVNSAVKILAVKGKLAKKSFIVFIPVSFKLDKS